MSPKDLGGLLERRAAESPGRPFLVMDGGDSRSFGELNEEVNRLAHGLRREGVSVGDRVGLMLYNCREFVVASLALKKLAAVEVAVNTGFRGPGLAHVLSLTDPTLLITQSALLEHVLDIAEALPTLHRIAVTDAWERGSSRDDLQIDSYANLLGDRTDNPRRAVHDTDLAAVLFTSGTTGPSKGCMLSHRFGVGAGGMAVRHLGLRPEDCLYCPFPLYHVDAAYLTLAPALIAGCRAGIGRRYSTSGFWPEVRAFGATVFDYMGATLTMLWKQPEAANDRDNPVRLAWGVPLPAWRREFERRFDLTLIQIYGLTDGGLPCWEDPTANEPPGSCGRVYDPFEVRIADVHDDPVAPDEVGEILLRSRVPDMMMKGYLNMPEATAAVFRNQWLHTGDLGRMDDDGHLFFEGRASDSIRRRGENISAWEIEEVLHAHPDVLEAVAVGVPSELSEEDVKVCVVLKESATLSAEELREFCRARMAPFMVPDLVEYVGHIPKTPTGKPEKYKLLAAHSSPPE